MKTTLERVGIQTFGVFLACTLAGAAWAQSATKSPHEQGRDLYRAKGCYECHGLAAQGAIGVAPALKPLRPSREAFQAYIRRPSGQMPPYSATLLTGPETEAIFDYLKSLPPSRNAAEIPLLAPFVARTRSTAPTSGAQTPADTPDHGPTASHNGSRAGVGASP